MTSVRIRVAGAQGLLHVVDAFDPVSIVHLSFTLGAITLILVNASELGRTPHLVSVELVRASELVAVGLCVHTVVEGVTRLETQFLIPALLLGVAHREELNIREVRHLY